MQYSKIQERDNPKILTCEIGKLKILTVHCNAHRASRN